MCLACETKIPTQDLEQFSAHYLEVLNHGALALMISIGHRTGLFQALRVTGPCTSAALAEAAELNERYVREWLGAMTAAHMVNCEGGKFTLEEAPARLFTGAEGMPNIAHLAQFIGLLGEVETQVEDCFRRGGGVPYSSYTRFHEVMAAESAQTVVGALTDHILPLDPNLVQALERGIDVLDVGCGRGSALCHLAKTFPASRFTGCDLSGEAIAFAQSQAGGLTNLRFEVKDLTHFHEEAAWGTYDLVTAFDAIHDQARPDHVLTGIFRSLKKDGLFLMQDIRASSDIAGNRHHPIGTLLYTISCLHCMTTSLAQGGMGLGTMWGEEQAVDFLKTAGFTRVSIHTLEHDIQNNYYLARA